MGKTLVGNKELNSLVRKTSAFGSFTTNKYSIMDN